MGTSSCCFSSTLLSLHLVVLPPVHSCPPLRLALYPGSRRAHQDKATACRSSSRSFLSPSSTSLVPRLSEGPPRQSYILPFFLPFILPPVHSYPPPGLGHAEVPTVPPWCLFNVEKTAEGERKHSHYALH